VARQMQAMAVVKTFLVNTFRRSNPVPDTKDKVKDAIDAGAQKAKEATDKAAEKAREAAKGVGKAVQDVGKKISDTGK
jgi:hypothetical protein